ncbi:MAG TPA: CopG family transcriptional regulator [Gemmatimonadota bacterium]|nr:CopG family transcriptional regulator [Gemmatimonadota bacterium]
MIRTQIQLTERQYRDLQKLAAEESVSMAEIVRRSLDRMLADAAPSRRELYSRAASIIGRFEDRDGATNLSGDHDRYLEEAFN